MGGVAIALSVAAVLAVPAAAAAAADHVAYAANGNDATVSIIDTRTASVLDTVAVDPGPSAVELSPDGRWLWIAHINGGRVSILDTDSRTIARTIDFGEGSRPFALCFAADGTLAYVTLEYAQEVVVLDAQAGFGAADPVLGRIGVGVLAHGIATAPEGGAVYVSGEDRFNRSWLIEIDPTSESAVASVAVDDDALGIGISADGGRAYVAAAGVVSIVDLARRERVSSLVFGREGPTVQNNHFVASAPNGAIYVTNRARGAVAVIDGGALASSFPVSAPAGIALSADGARAFVTEEELDDVVIIDTGSGAIAATVPVGDRPGAIAVADGGGVVAQSSDGGCAMLPAPRRSWCQALGALLAAAITLRRRGRRMPR